ncbi:hypothetical protein EJB05_33406 [Eragrostis curvula]|uniref:RING-type E3 ubiquitin transferase n=1 Tax=Eragrostis curvula TaxID=38414 RepID=A0A5J9U1E7_9POAL|nr:hypothetical protein EJB05_33406 [Eragrostis curvula]
MAGHHHNNSQIPRIDHVNQLHNEPSPFGPKLFMHPRRDAPNGVISSGYGSATVRSNDLPSSSYAGPSQQNGTPGALHGSYAGYPHTGSSSSIYDPRLTALSYPHRPEDNFILNPSMDDRRIAQKRRNPIIHPMDGASVGSYYAASSSNSQFSQHMPPNPIPAPEFCPPRVPSNFSSSRWSDHHFGDHGGSLRNVRGRHDHSSIHLGHSPAVSSHGSTHHANANAPSLSTAIQQDRAPFSIPPRVVPPGIGESTSMAFRERPYYPPQRTNISAPVASLPGSSDSMPFVHGGYAPRSVSHNTIRTYPAPAFATSSNSGAISYEPAIPSYHPAAPSYLPASSAASSSVQPFHAEPAATLRHLGHAALGHSGSARSRRSRDTYHGFHPLMIEEDNLGRSAAERFMMLDQLVIHESREANDPHWDMRLDIDDMSYEELLALEERIGNVNTGLADEKISGCVMEVACCSSSRLQDDKDNTSCVICLEEYKLKDFLGSLKCGHDFHADCIKKWLQVKNACPVCKAAAVDDSGGTK